MPITTSAKKALKQTKTKTKRNVIIKEKVKKITRKVDDLIKDDKLEEAKKALNQAYKTIDKAAKRNIFKKNTAGRKKSRLSRSINKAKAVNKEKPKKKK